MGFNDRDYYRDSNSSGTLGGLDLPTHSICFKLVVANIVVFLLQIFSTRDATRSDFADIQNQQRRMAPHSVQSEDLPVSNGDVEHALRYMPRVSIVQEWLQLETDKVLHGQVWRLLTGAFCHDRESISHILFNMLFLWWWGRTLEGVYGAREFLLFYLAGALVASFSFMALDAFGSLHGPMIGASGAVMATMMLYAIHYPRQTILIFFVIPIEVRWLVFFYVIYDLHPVLLLLSGTPSFDGVAHAAHLGGFAFGWLYWKWGLRLEPWVDRCSFSKLWWRRKFGAQRHFKVVRADDDQMPDRSSVGDLDARVDQVLAKLHEHGKESLTEDDHKVLEAGRQRYRTRRGIEDSGT